MRNSNFVKSKDAYMSLQPAHFYKTEVWVEEGFEVTFGKLLSIWTSPTPLAVLIWEAKVIN